MKEEEGAAIYPGLSEYCDISRTHTMCQFSPGSVSERCGQVVSHRITEQIKGRLLEQHNRLRRRVAKGQEIGQPAASNMLPLMFEEPPMDTTGLGSAFVSEANPP